MLLPRDPKYQVPFEALLPVHGKPNNIKTTQETAFLLQINLPKQVQQVACSLMVAQGAEQHVLVNLKAALSGLIHITKDTTIISLTWLAVSLYVSFPPLQKKQAKASLLLGDGAECYREPGERSQGSSLALFG